ncbi:MAG: hypothetical protein IT384_17940 [Deltaproteobacteria bacterium]|nr:hypothetical protein [Deltaproteobacteria bacterium]
MNAAALTVLVALAAEPSGGAGPSGGAEPVGGARDPRIPPDVQRCIDARKMWVADPDYFEPTQVTGRDGRSRPAFQILDRSAGRVGHLLVVPEGCRILVLAVEADGQPRLYLLPGDRPSAAELVQLLRWAKYRAVVPGRPSPREPKPSFARLDEVVWIAHGHALEVVDLDRGEVRRLIVATKPRAACEVSLVSEGLRQPCSPGRLLTWKALEKWREWPTTPNALDGEP